MRVLYAERQAALVEAARSELEGVLELNPSGSGLHLIGWLAGHLDDQQVTRDTLDQVDAGGRFRGPEEDVRVIDNTDGEVLHEPPAADQLPVRMEAMCKFANGTSGDEPFIHPVAPSNLWLMCLHLSPIIGV